MEYRFLKRTKKISLSQVDFKEYFEFYRDFICPYRYLYELEDNTKIEIRFHEEHFPHLLGLHKLKRFKKIKKSSEIIKEIINNNVNIRDIETAERKTFDNRELKDRITIFLF